MLQDLKICIDGSCEFKEILWPWVIEEFYSLDNHRFQDGVVYIIDRQRMVESGHVIRAAINQTSSRFVFSLPFEGSETMVNHMLQYKFHQELLDKKLLLISGGDMAPEYPHLSYDLFLTKFHNFPENISAQSRTPEIFSKHDKPYKFLFLNGRERPHRKYLTERFEMMGLLDHAIWSYLSPIPAGNRHTRLMHDGIDLMARPRPVKMLDPYYEVDRYKDSVIDNDKTYVKMQLFGNEWGDIYVNPLTYTDTYFSVVTETVFDYPYSFRTEKIVKPLGMGHPFVVAANRGYYRDLQNLGFRTFGHLIDESFDQIDDNQTRLERITTVVNDLCQQDLKGFLLAAEEICKYNQQHLLEIKSKIQQEFLDRFFQFLEKYGRP